MKTNASETVVVIFTGIKIKINKSIETLSDVPNRSFGMMIKP